MCRWIAVISQEPVLLEDVLIDAPHPITDQIHTHYLPDNPEGPGGSEFNFDGFGVTWYTNTRSRFDADTKGPRPALYKTTVTPTTDPTFTFVCANTASKCFMSHIRAATLPPVASTNNHPFVFGRHSFMHNGSIAQFRAIRVEMLKEINIAYAGMIYGNTDTEHLAALYFTYLGDIERSYPAVEMRNAMALAIKKVQEIQRRVLGSQPPNNMNLCATDGENLVALRWRNDILNPNNAPPSLYVSYDAIASLNRRHKLTPYCSSKVTCTPEQLTDGAKPAFEQRMRFKEWNPHGPHVIVASEPATFNQDEWSTLENGQFIMVDKTGVLSDEGIPPIQNKSGRQNVPTQDGATDTKDKSPSETDGKVLEQNWGVSVAFNYLED